MDAKEQYQQRRHQRAATHAGQTDEGADDKTGEWIEPVHGRYNSGMVHHRDTICGSDGRGSQLRRLSCGPEGGEQSACAT